MNSWSDSGWLVHCAILSIELLDAACSIDDLLLAGIERMAGRAYFNVKRLLHRRLGLEHAAAGAGDFDFVVVGVDIGFHLEKFL